MLELVDGSLNKKPCIITVGISCAGKTTWAENYVKDVPGFVISCRDDIRKSMSDTPFRWDTWNANNRKNNEKKVTQIQREQLQKYANDPNVKGIIIADTNLTERRFELQKFMEELGCKVSFQYLYVSWDDAVKRDNHRECGVGVSVISKQYQQWCELFHRLYTPIEDLPYAIVCDLDGTLAHHTDRGIYEYNKVHQDELDPEVARIVKAFAVDHEIIILTGRQVECYEETKKWLIDNLGFEPKLYMRTEPNDRTHDVEFKGEIFWKNLAYHYNVRLIIEDRPRVARFFRSIGCKVLQCGNPYIEF